MKIEKKDQKKGKYKLSITVEPQDLVRYFNSSYEKLAKDVKIDGFRPGKAPRKLVEEAIGQARLLSDSLDRALQESYFLAIQQEKLIPVCPPKVTISKYPTWGLEMEDISEPLIFDAEFEVMPEVKLLDYSKIRIKKKDLAKIKNDDIEKVLLHLRRQKANFLDVDRVAKNGDRVEISYEGSIDKVKKDSMTAKNQPIILGNKTLIPGFEENIIDMKKGEEKEFEISFPKDYHSKEYAGKKAKFNLKLIDLKEIKLPELDSQFAAGFGQKDANSLRVAIEKSLKDEVEAKAKNELETEVLEKVLPKLIVEIPDSLIEQETDRIISGMEEQTKSRGLSLPKYLESIKKTLPDMRRDLRLQAEKNVKVGFLLGKIIEEQKFDPTDREAGKKALEYLISKIVK